MLYHREVFWKDNFDKDALKVVKSAKTVSNHLWEHLEDGDSKHNIDVDMFFDILENVQSAEFIRPFEVEANYGIVEKVVVREGYDKDYDICIVFRKGIVVTAWINKKYDEHYTLDYNKYATR